MLTVSGGGAPREGVPLGTRGWEPGQPSPAPRSPRGPSEAPREEFQPFPLRRAVCGLLAARPQRGPEVGAGGAGPSPAASGSCPGLAVPLQIPGWPPLVPGDQTGPGAAPGRRGAAGNPGSSPRGRSRRNRSRPTPDCLLGPRRAPYPAGPQNLSLKLKVAFATSPWGTSLSLSKRQFLHL